MVPFCFCFPHLPILSVTTLLYLFTPTFLSASNSPVCTLSFFLFMPHPNYIIFLSLFSELLHLSILPSVNISHLLLPNTPLFASHATSPSCTYRHLYLSPLFPFCLHSEGTVRAPAVLQVVVKAAQTVTWSAWNRGPGAAQTQTAPTAPFGHLSLRLAASLASPSLPEGIALEATKGHREAAKALVLVRTVDMLPLANL